MLVPRSSTDQVSLALGLPVRNRPGLEQLIRDLYDPASPLFHHYLSAEVFAQRFGPTEEQYQALVQFARSNDLSVIGTHPNRLILDVKGPVGQIEKAFGVNLRWYNHPSEARAFYAPDVEPTVPEALPLLHISGLNNFIIPRPAGLARLTAPPANAMPQTGSAPQGAFAGRDFRGAYARNVALTGAGQMVGLVEFDGFYSADITAYGTQFQVAPCH
jgi:subtilase family serine protease